jgi:uncharacterized membrane protein
VFGRPVNGYLRRGQQATPIADLPYNTAYVSDINNLGQLVGGFRYHDPVDPEGRGWFFDGAQYHQVRVPGSSQVEVLGLNDLGVVVGFYSDPTTQSTRGFTAVWVCEPSTLALALLAGCASFARGRLGCRARAATDVARLHPRQATPP